jgi:SNF2 family DNA or RNA helicase
MNISDLSDNFLYIHKKIIDENINQCHDFKLYHTDIHQLLNSYTNLKITIDENGQNVSSFLYNDPFDFSYSCYSSDFLLYPFLNWKNKQELQREYQSNSRLYRQLRFFIDNTYHRASIICKLHKDNNKLYMNYYINKKLVNHFISGKQNYKIYIIRSILNWSIFNFLNNKCENELNNILDILPTNSFEEDHAPKLNITLFNYQIEDIKWMNCIEQNVSNKNNIINYIYKPYINLQLNNESLDILTPCLIIDSQDSNYIYYQNQLLKYNQLSQNFDLLNSTFTFFGGNLINSVGLGKTIITLCHILKKQNKFDKFVEFQDDELCNYFYKRGSNKGHTCSKQIKVLDKFYCKEHSNTPFIDKRKTCYNNLGEFNIYEYITPDKNLYNTNSNLIICPSHLADQWAREYYSHFTDASTKSGKRILMAITQDQFLNLTFGDILFSDIIITTYNFLNNKLLQNTVGHNLVKSLLLNKYDLLNSKDNSLKQFSNFKFDSIILDESHEIKNNNIKYIINRLSSNFKWNITGTPFANGVGGFVDIISYISKGIQPTELPLHNKNLELIKSSSSLFRRNTSDSIKHEVTKNLITFTTKLLTFTDQERNIYDSYLKGNSDKNYNFLIKLCCHPEIDQETKNIIKNCKTLSEIQTALLDHNHLKITKSISIQKKLEYSIKIKEEQLSLFYTEKRESHEIEPIKTDISNDKRNLTNEKKNYDIIKRIYDYLKNVIDNIKEADTCPICLDDTDIQNLAITKCGHKLCWDCLNEYLNNTTHQVKCPKCNTPISKDDIFKYKEEKENISENPNETGLNNLIYKVKSTKIGNILHYINTELAQDDKCIIFSQWDEILNKISDSLTQPHVYCKGTVFQKKKAIKSFSEDPNTNIILLSSKNAASGTNLTAANKIILVEPIYGTDKYRQDIENQSIGRSNRIGQKRQIEVIRFIIKDTIEEICLDTQIDSSN